MKWILLLALCLPSLGFAKDKTTRCKVSADCIKVDDLCSRKTSIHLKFMENHEKYVRETGLLIQCVEPKKEELDLDASAVAACRKHRCVLEQPKGP